MIENYGCTREINIENDKISKAKKVCHHLNENCSNRKEVASAGGMKTSKAGEVRSRGIFC